MSMLVQSKNTKRLKLVATGAFLLAVAVVAWIALDPGLRTPDPMPDTVSEMPEGEFGKRVRAYLLKNPEVIVDAMKGLQARQRAAQLGDAQTILESRADEVFRDPESPVGGNRNGDVTLVEFFDYNCPYCRRVAPAMLGAEAADPQLRIVYKEFPILGPDSVFAARAALAARKQDRYVAFHKALMKVNGRVDEDTAMRVAAEVGLDTDRLRADMQAPAIGAAIDRNLQLARALRITGTPSFAIGDQIIRGLRDLKTLQASIERARQRRRRR